MGGFFSTAFFDGAFENNAFRELCEVPVFTGSFFVSVECDLRNTKDSSGTACSEARRNELMWQTR